MKFERSEDYKKCLLMICVVLWIPILYVISLVSCANHNGPKARFLASCIEKQAGLPSDQISAECKDVTEAYREQTLDCPKLKTPRRIAFECFTSPKSLDTVFERQFVIEGKQYIECIRFSGSSLVSVSWDENDLFDPPIVEVEGSDHLQKASETQRE